MDCVRENVAGCPTINGSLAKTKHVLKKVAQESADIAENCIGRHGMKGSSAGTIVIHKGCQRVIADSKGK